MSDLKFGEYKVYSVDQLLKDKPEKLEGLKIVCNEAPDNYSIHINDTNVFCRSYNISYLNGCVIIHFKNKSGEVVANISASGSSEWKTDECFIVGYNEIISQTSMRVMNGVLKNTID